MGSTEAIDDDVSHPHRPSETAPSPGLDDEDQTPAEAEEGWVGLLSTLSDEELKRYGEIARDQKALEWNSSALQAVAAGGSVLLIAAIVAEIYAGWSWYFVSLTALIAGACANFPWQKHRMRSLWARHIRAVEMERSRRARSRAADRCDSKRH